MSLRAPLKDNKGFTIIEVMIVLTIAGLIMLIVFLAVPALQRNSRNTQRRSDAARFSSIISEFVVNNNGKVPSSIVNAPPTDSSQVSIQNEDFSYFDPTAFKMAVATDGSLNGGCTIATDDAGNNILNSCTTQPVAVATGAVAPVSNAIDTIGLVTGFTCDNNNLISSGSRSYAVVFSVENSGGGNDGIAQCV